MFPTIRAQQELDQAPVAVIHELRCPNMGPTEAIVSSHIEVAILSDYHKNTNWN